MPQTFAAVLKQHRTARRVTITRHNALSGRDRVVTAPLSSNELAHRAGLNAAGVHRLERGDWGPTRSTVLALADALSLDSVETDLLLASAGYLPVHLGALADHELAGVLRQARLQYPRAMAGGEREDGDG